MHRDTIANYVRPATAINRLLRLEEIIRKAPKKRFQIGSYRCKIGVDVDMGEELKPARSLSCDTAGCIAGWGTCVAPELSFRNNGDKITNDRLPRRRPPYSYIAFGAAFGLTKEEADRLCLCDLNNKETPKAAADAVGRLAQELAEYHGYDIV